MEMARSASARTMCMARVHSFVRKTASQTANRPHRKAAAPRRESAASLAAPRHVSVTVVKFSKLDTCGAEAQLYEGYITEEKVNSS